MKPPTAIRSAVPLSQSPARGDNPLRCCNVCGVDVDPTDLPLETWRECDERDNPIPGNAALVFVGRGTEHTACAKALDDHPRLYVHGGGRPGAFPRLCGNCRFRDGLGCTHPELKVNGGEGLRVSFEGPFAKVRFCMSRGGFTLKPDAIRCVGREES